MTPFSSGKDPGAAGSASGPEPASARAQATPITLPAPRTDGGMPLQSALKLRRSVRSYSSAPLSPQQLSDLLWSACGVNRETGDRTAPFWRHRIVLDVYVLQGDGVTIYDPVRHALLPHLKADLRKAAGQQDFVGTAPLELVYVAHGEKMADITTVERHLYASVDAAFIGQNVYLYCASANLGTVFRGAVDAVRLGRELQLPESDFVTFAQTVGFALP